MTKYGKWGEDVIHPKILKQYGYECIGNIHKEWNTGLSTNTIEKILVEHKVLKYLYDYVNENMHDPQTHTAYNIKQASAAILSVITTAKKVTPQRWESPEISSRFQLLHFSTDKLLEITKD